MKDENSETNVKIKEQTYKEQKWWEQKTRLTERNTSNKNKIKKQRN